MWDVTCVQPHIYTPGKQNIVKKYSRYISWAETENKWKIYAVFKWQFVCVYFKYYWGVPIILAHIFLRENIILLFSSSNENDNSGIAWVENLNLYVFKNIIFMCIFYSLLWGANNFARHSFIYLFVCLFVVFFNLFIHFSVFSVGIWRLHLCVLCGGDGPEDGGSGRVRSQVLPWRHVEPPRSLYRHGRVSGTTNKKAALHKPHQKCVCVCV